MQVRSRIAVIDDDASFRSALVSLVEAVDYVAVGFASADEFLGSGRPETFDCVVTDIHLPGRSGVSLKFDMAQLGHDVPVIMVTGRTEPHLHRRAIASGAACLLKKPFAPNELVDTIRGCLSERR
ncbi:MAG TPA: response regulator [Sphingomicrobium sp.]|nr:response regulator [Sphingomicrobium sp.]